MTDPKPAHQISPDEIRRILGGWLSHNMNAQVAVSNLTPVAGAGFSAETLFADLEIDHGGRHSKRRVILRRQNSDSDFFLGAGLELPYRMMETLRERTSVPVPGVLGLELDITVMGSPFMVMETVEGRSVHQRPNYNVEGWLVEMTPVQRAEVWKNGLAALAEIHKLDWHDGFEFLDQPSRGQPGLDQYLHWVTEWYTWARRDRPHPIHDLAFEFLRDNRPARADEHVSVLWGDPTPSNLMFRGDGSIAAVIDWEMASLGPAEVDLAWWLFMDDLFSAGMGIPRADGLPDRAASIAYYEQCLGRGIAQTDLHYYDVLATFRMAIVGMRAVDREIDRGKLPTTTTARTHAPIVRMLAAKLDQPQPEIGEDFHTFARLIGLYK